MADEGVLFEGVRLGSRRAFEELLDHVDPTMRRLGRLYVPEAAVGPLVATTWQVALPGLDMFTWHTSLRAWLTGIFVTYARAAAVTAPRADAPSAGPVPVRDPAVVGDVPWETLAWSAHWSPTYWADLADTLASLPLPQREVLWLRDVERWELRETLDCLGLTAAQGEQLLDAGHDTVAAGVATLVSASPAAVADRGRRHHGVTRLLAELRQDPAAATDPGPARVFTVWRRHRRVRVWRRWSWELGRRRAG
ncbi:RNA polymerase sigma factor [Aquipuribacter sp. SD81]|uniref:RNA polymerase sigma factor n=1 Tax=Aquipuribacter sp. SD81 TaxID=3127703 RepID=UPI003017085F